MPKGQTASPRTAPTRDGDAAGVSIENTARDGDAAGVSIENTASDGDAAGSILNTTFAAQNKAGSNPGLFLKNARVGTTLISQGSTGPKTALRDHAPLHPAAPGAERDFWEIVDDAIAENIKYVASCPWPPPAAMDPFNFVGSDKPAPYNFHSADGQWEMLKELGRRQEVRNQAQLRAQSSPEKTYAEVTRGCVAFSTEPNTRKVRFREGIDSPQALASSALGEIGPLLLEEDSPAELFNVSSWQDLDVEMVLQRLLRAHSRRCAGRARLLPAGIRG